MAFTVETGSGVVGANAYIDVAYADSYHADRNNKLWVGTDAVKQAAIVRATDYLETRWGDKFLGLPQYPDTPQGLAWPRLGVFDGYGRTVTGIPDNLKRAVAEYAVRALSADLSPDPVYDETGRTVTSKREKVGPIETEVAYNFNGTFAITRSYPQADRLLRTLIAGGSSMGGRVFRA